MFPGLPGSRLGWHGGREWRHGPGCRAWTAVGCGAIVRRGAAGLRRAGRRGAEGAGGAASTTPMSRSGYGGCTWPRSCPYLRAGVRGGGVHLRRVRRTRTQTSRRLSPGVAGLTVAGLGSGDTGGPGRSCGSIQCRVDLSSTAELARPQRPGGRRGQLTGFPTGIICWLRCFFARMCCPSCTRQYTAVR